VTVWLLKKSTTNGIADEKFDGHRGMVQAHLSPDLLELDITVGQLLLFYKNRLFGRLP